MNFLVSDMVTFYVLGYSLVGLIVIAIIALPIITALLFKKAMKMKDEDNSDSEI